MWKRLRQWLAASTPARDEDGAPRIEPGLDEAPAAAAPGAVAAAPDPLDRSPLGEAGATPPDGPDNDITPLLADALGHAHPEAEVPVSRSARADLPDTPPPPPAPMPAPSPAPETVADKPIQALLDLDPASAPPAADLDDWLDQPAEHPSEAPPPAEPREPALTEPEPRAAPQPPATPAAPAPEPAWHDAAPPAATARERAEPMLDADADAPPPWAESRLEPSLDAPAPSRDAPAPPDEPRTAHAEASNAAKPPAPAAITPAPPPPAAAPAPVDEPVLVHVFATLRETQAPRFACLAQEHLDTASPEMAEHMAGLIQYVQGRNPAAMTQRGHALWRHLQRVRHLWRLSLMPDQLEALGQWAGEINAVVALPDGSVRDPKGYVLLAAPGGHDDRLARLPHPPDAWQRKLATETRLQARGWQPPASLPPVAGEGEIDLRPVPEVVGRALALLLVAVRAESLTAGGGDTLTPERLRQKLPAAFAHLSPQEDAFVHQDAPGQAQIVAMGWRYESLHLLLWALGLVDELPWPDGLCDVSRCVSLLLEADANALMRDAALRPASEILDQLDLHLRLHWLLRDAELQGRAAPAEVRRGVVMERHHALNWLIGFENAEWDRVGTPT